MLREIRDVLAEHLQVSGVDEHTHLFRDLELDSVQQLTFVVEIENHFEICFDDGDEATIQTVGDVVDAVSRKLLDS